MNKEYMLVLSYFRGVDDLGLEYQYLNNIQECSKAIKKYVKIHKLKSSEWTGGQVYKNEHPLKIRLGIDGEII